MKPDKEYSLLEYSSEAAVELEAEEPPISTKWWKTTLQFNPIEVAGRFTCIAMFITGALMMVTALRWAPSDRYCAGQLGVWSPLLESVEYEERNWESNHEKKILGFTGPPTAEMEAKWRGIVEVPGVTIPPERITSLNRSINDGFMPISPSDPSLGYIAGVEVFHHLHCLNVLRQYIWRDSYPNDLIPSLLKFNSLAVAQKHADHCIDTLRQALMCTGDITPYLVYKKETPYSTSDVPVREDFQAFHKCRNLSKLLKWVTENGVAPSWRE
ncbi:hypothetical protein LZ30DRAFT_591290 [Colletotrichum cereale]|nr:hypothetical protein LZ30DRAFT_591290 [Colletotrichum cereale]